MAEKSKVKSSGPIRTLLVAVVAIFLLLILALAAGLFAAAIVFPSFGASQIDNLRQVFGDYPVAQLETTIYDLQDAAQQWEYQHGVDQPTGASMSPINIAGAPDATQSPPTETPLPAPTPWLHIAGSNLPTPSADKSQAKAGGAQTSTDQRVLSSIAEPSWTLAPLVAPAPTNGAGQWVPFLKGASDNAIAYRTFLQPDPVRPYAIAAIVAFDLKATRLHFVLGKVEPISRVAINRTGRIPSGDEKVGLLLAAFNGGFKARHGNFGTMVNGVTVLPPRPGIGTLAIYADGQVHIGEWGTEIVPSSDMAAWRQNGPLIIHNGQINPHTADFSPQDWGYTIDHATAVWRSGIGLSADGRTLYYVAGPSLTLPMLAKAMADAGAYEAMQLDINNTMVHFDSFQANGTLLQPQPLFNTMKYQDDNRYLTSDDRDFFYVTANNSGA